MEVDYPQLHILFFPFMAHGHMIPTVDMAKLFAMRGIKSTIVSTPHNVPFFSDVIQRSKNSGLDINVRTLNFPSIEVGLSEGCENVDSINGSIQTTLEMVGKFFRATGFFQQPFEQLIQECKPDCLVTDLFFGWANETAEKFGIPSIIFNGNCYFSLCLGESISSYEPHKKVDSDSELFLIPNLPDEIRLSKQQLPLILTQYNDENFFTNLFKAWRETELKSYGVIVNSFYELEKTYVNHYRNVLGRKSWHIGPVSLCNRAIEDKANRGNRASIDEHECLKWLDSKLPNSVIYICFGSVANFTSAQLIEIASAIEASGQEFIWVVRKDKKEGNDDWLPDGFEKRIEGKGLIIRGWAPQILILEHEAVGGFVTHCGWNSILEAVSAGLPMVTWPVFAEQFYNEKLVTQVLKIGVGVGAKKWVQVVGDFVGRDAIEKAVKEIMVGDAAEEMRSRAKEFGKMAKRAVENGGSSFSDLNSLIDELVSLRR